jgi:hypothetical protein
MLQERYRDANFCYIRNGFPGCNGRWRKGLKYGWKITILRFENGFLPGWYFSFIINVESKEPCPRDPKTERVNPSTECWSRQAALGKWISVEQFVDAP